MPGSVVRTSVAAFAVLLAGSLLGGAPAGAAAPARPVGHYGTNHGCGPSRAFVPPADADTVPTNEATDPATERALVHFRQASQRRTHRRAHWLSSVSCRPGRRSHAPDRRAVGPTGSTAAGDSYNWSGYDTNLDAAAVEQAWTVPTLEPNYDGTEGQSAENTIWPGVGGENGTVLLQAGTDTSGSCANGGPCGGETYFWFEIVPDNPTEVIIGNLPVTQQDQVAVEVVQEPDHTLFWLACNYGPDDTRNDCAENVARPAPGEVPGRTAEWVVERATTDGHYTRLNGFNQLDISSAAVLPQGENTDFLSLTAAHATPLRMVGCDGALLAEPGPVIGPQGTEFIDYWKAYGNAEPTGCRG